MAATDVPADAPLGADYRVVAGLRVPLSLVSRLIEAIIAAYPEETAGIADPDEAVRVALRAWVVGLLVEHEAEKVADTLPITIAQTVADNEHRAKAAGLAALEAATGIVQDTGL